MNDHFFIKHPDAFDESYHWWACMFCGYEHPDRLSKDNTPPHAIIWHNGKFGFLPIYPSSQFRNKDIIGCSEFQIAKIMVS